MSDLDDCTIKCIVIATDTQTIAAVKFMNEQNKIVDFVFSDVTKLFKKVPDPSTRTILYYMMYYAETLDASITMHIACIMEKKSPVEYEQYYYEDHTSSSAD
jgi:hypothetical protein